MPEIEINSISKQFGEVRALTDVNITVNANEFFGLIGPDGAGKLLCCVLLPHFCLQTQVV